MQAVRILLQSIESAANRYKRYIKPILSLSMDFYVRVFVRVYTSAAEIKKSASKLCYLYQSLGCDSFYLQRVGDVVQKGNNAKFTPGHGPAAPQICPETGSGFSMGGPFWAEPTHDPEAIREILAVLQKGRDSFQSFTKASGLDLPGGFTCNRGAGGRHDSLGMCVGGTSRKERLPMPDSAPSRRSRVS